MYYAVFQLCLLLVAILIAAELFTNGLEHLGQNLKISQGVTGSLFAAVGTALPETVIPLLAIATAGSDKLHNEEISVGAILGAPLMLATLSIFLMALFAAKKRGVLGRIMPEPQGFRRDTGFFLLAFFIAALAMYIPPSRHALRLVISISLVALYFLYVTLTLRASQNLVEAGDVTEAAQPLLISKIGMPLNGWAILIQLMFSVGILLTGAYWFIDGVIVVSSSLGISVLLLSLIIIPIATELPEKVNSILWIRQGRDTLAVGNITGAMVFQGTLLPAIGIMLTPWQPRPEVLTGIVITLLAALWLWLAGIRRVLPVWWLLPNGLLYVFYIALSLYH